MTSSIVVNLNGAAHTTGPAVPGVETITSPCFNLSSKDYLSNSSTSSKKAAEIRGTKSVNVKVALPRAVSLCDLASSNNNSSSCSGAGQVRGSSSLPSLLNTVCISSPVTISGRINRLEAIRCAAWNRSSRSSDSERRCYPVTEREPVTEKNEAETSSGSEFPSSGLSQLSHFLRELARQDCWAGLFEPFQGAGNFSPGNFPQQGGWKLGQTPASIPILQDRFPSNMTAPDYNSQLSIASSAAVEEEQSSGYGSAGTSSLSSACMPASDVHPHATSSESRIRTSSDPAGRMNGSGPQLEVNGSLSSSSVRIHDIKPHAELCHKSGTCVTAEEIGSCENLARWLEERTGSSALNQWGNDAATKRVANLWCELVKGEISLEDSRPPKRTAHVASVKIRNEQGHVLVEAYQEMADGRVRPRNRPLSEKMRPGEHVEEACLRGIYEELGCQLGARERVVMVPESYRREEEERESFSYPGLPTRYVIHTMVAHIDQLPSTEFSTEEDESDHGTTGVSSGAGSSDESVSSSNFSSAVPVGVKRHFWKWVPENELAQVCRR